MEGEVSNGALWIMGTLQVFVNGAMLAIVGAWIKSKDESITSLKEKVDKQHEARIETLEREQEHAKKSRGIIYSDKVSKSDCQNDMNVLRGGIAKFESSVLKLERIQAKMETAIDDLERVQHETASQAKSIAALQERTKGI